MNIVLNSSEISVLFRQDPATAGDGGFQGLMVGLQRKCDQTTGKIVLSNDDLEKIPRYAFDYHMGGWEDRLMSVFTRTLGPGLGRDR
jgi:hypothetical protein